MPAKTKLRDEVPASLLEELAESNGALRRTVSLQVDQLRRLANLVEEEGDCLQILGRVEGRIPNLFMHGSEMKGAADMMRDWADNLDSLITQTKETTNGQ